MATLPDLDTSQVSNLAYWNVISDGGLAADLLAPDEVLSSASVSNTIVYDNGVSGDYTLSNGRVAKFRVKSDGWFVVYIDRTLDRGLNLPSRPEGPYDIIGWNEGGININPLSQNQLERAINDLFTELSESGGATYNSPDVGLFNYRYPSAVGVTGMSFTDSINSINSSSTANFTVTAETVFKSGYVTGFFQSPHVYTAYTEYNGNRASNYGDNDILDLEYANLIPGTGVENDVYMHLEGGNYGELEGMSSVLITWG